jgi:hypothetical protein
MVRVFFRTPSGIIILETLHAATQEAQSSDHLLLFDDRELLDRKSWHKGGQASIV